MDLQIVIYVVIGSFLLFLGLIYFSFQLIGYLLLGNSPKPIDEEQKVLCHDAIHKGDAGSVFCRYYVKRGFCPHGDCELLKK